MTPFSSCPHSCRSCTQSPTQSEQLTHVHTVLDLLNICLSCRLKADEALQRVQRAFDTRKDEQRRSPETDQQHQMVRDFVAKRK